MSDNADIVRAGIRIHPDEPADVMVDLKQRALAALDAMEARERDLVAERDEARQEAADMTAGQRGALARAWAAEAEVKRLREALERVDSELDGINVDAAQRVARAALGEQP